MGLFICFEQQEFKNVEHTANELSQISFFFASLQSIFKITFAFERSRNLNLLKENLLFRICVTSDVNSQFIKRFIILNGLKDD